MAPIFKTSTGLPLAVYIEPSSSNRAALLKAILSNGGAPCPRIPNANVILIDAQSRDGRECARQLCADPGLVVLFHEWIDACLSAGKLLGDDLNWGNLRIQDPEIVDESLYVEDNASPQESVAHVKLEDTHAAPAERNHRPWPTPTSPTRPTEGQLPVPAGLPSRTAPTPPLVKSETVGAISGLSHQQLAHSPQQSPIPEPAPAKSLSPSKAKSTTPLPSYGHLPLDPELGSLFRSACEEWSTMKKEAESYAPPVLKRKSYPVDRQTPAIKSPRLETSQDRTAWSPTSAPIYEPLARKQRPPLPAGSTKRGPKRRNPAESTQLDQLASSSGEITPSQSWENLNGLGGESPSPMPSSPRPAEKLFTLLGKPFQFWLQMDLPDRGSVIRLLKKHGGQIAGTLEDASYVIVSRAAPQYAELLVEADAVGRVSVPVAWIHQCAKENNIVPVDDYAVASSLVPRVNGLLTEAEIIRAATADVPPAPSIESQVLRQTGTNKFTLEDQAYMQRSLAWKYARDPGFSIREFCEDLANSSPNHSFHSWQGFYYRPTSEVSRVLAIVQTLLS